MPCADVVMMTAPMKKTYCTCSGCVQHILPDAVVIQQKASIMMVLEYTRPSDTVPGALQEAVARKTRKYAVICSVLLLYVDSGWQVLIFPLPVGV